jgi:hypothetical protein
MKRVLGVGGPLTAALIAILVMPSVSAADPFQWSACGGPGDPEPRCVQKPPFYAHVGLDSPSGDPERPLNSVAHARWTTSPKRGYIRWVLERQRRPGTETPWYTAETAPASSTRKFGKTGSRKTFHVPSRSWPLERGYTRFKVTFTFKRARTGPDLVVKRLVTHSRAVYLVPGLPPGGPG